MEAVRLNSAENIRHFSLPLIDMGASSTDYLLSVCVHHYWAAANDASGAQGRSAYCSNEKSNT